MRLVPMPPRPDWKQSAEDADFDFHTMHGEPYWDETVAYEFSLAEIEDGIEGPATELHEMAMEAVGEIVRSEELLTAMAIPGSSWDLLRKSWAEAEPQLYGRFDLAFDGQGAARLYEYNADTPTSLFEAASFQWGWLEEMIASEHLDAQADQFNAIWEALGRRWPLCMKGDETDIHFAGDLENAEDMATLRVLAQTAQEAGFTAHELALKDIGADADGRLLDANDRVIGTMFKLYPWEDLLRDDFAGLLRGADCRFLEPAWKAVLSNKGLMAVMWRMFEGHPNLLPCLFEADAKKGGAFVSRTLFALGTTGVARKPVLSREGAGVTLTAAGGRILEASAADGYGHHPHILQALSPLPDFGGRRPVIGAWIVGDECVGMGIRDDASAITGNLSRFVPHYIAN